MTTTRGFDFVGEMRTTVPNTILHGFWLAGVFPSYIPAGDVGVLERVEVFLGSPAGGFYAGETQGSLVARISQNVIFRADNRPGEWTNTLRVSASCAVREIAINGVAAQELSLEFADEDNLTVEWAEQTDALAVEAVIQGILRGRIRDIGRTIPLSPILLGQPLRFFPIDGDGQLALKLYCNMDNRDGTPPDGKQDALLDPFPLKPWLPDDMAVAIDGERLLALARQFLADRGLVSGATIVDDFGQKLIDLGVSGDVTIDLGTGISFLPSKITLPLALDLSPKIERIELTSDLSISLHSGYVRVKGSIFAAIDYAFDVDADFDLKVGLTLVGKKVVASVRQADIDVDSTIYQVLAALLFLPAAALIADAIDDAIDKMASSAVQGTTFSEDIPVETFVFGSVALTDDETENAFGEMLEAGDTPPTRPVIIRAKPTNIFVRPDAVVLQMTIHADAPGAAPLVRPQYHIAHKKTMQVHLPDCKYGNLIKFDNRELFVRASEAVAVGYDGCRKCLMLLDGEGVGGLYVTYRRAVGLKKKRATAVKMAGKFLQGSKQPNFQQPWSEEGSFSWSNQDGEWIDQFDVPKLAPGQWEVTVVDGDWSATRVVTIAGGHVANPTFVFGKDAPAIGPSVGSIEVLYRVPRAAHMKKKVDVLFEGKWAGDALPEGETAFWTRKAAVDFEVEPGVQGQRVRLFLPSGPWVISVLEYGKKQEQSIEVSAAAEAKVSFDRPV